MIGIGPIYLIGFVALIVVDLLIEAGRPILAMLSVGLILTMDVAIIHLFDRGTIRLG